MTTAALTRRRVELRGAARTLFRDAGHTREVVLSGPAGTGKSRGALEWLHCNLRRYPGSRALMVRKTRSSLTQSAMVTYEREVLHPLEPIRFMSSTQEYRYDNASLLVVGGMDRASKVMSAEYDLIYVQEATELEEDDWEALTTRLRYGRMPFQQLVGDCNPQAPTHWLKQRANRGATLLLESRHEDNPRLWQDGRWTADGERYMAVLDALTGVRYKRLRLGQWVAAEGQVYEGWDRALHLVDSFIIPWTWPRYISIDWGYTNPSVIGWWAEDPDGRLYRYREIYRTHQLVEDLARQVKDISQYEPAPSAVICDHDAEGRATFERYTGWETTPAQKTVSDGIQAVAARLRPAGDGKPRLFFLRDALELRDPDLDERKLPCCTEEEFESYVWDTGGARQRGEQPKKEHDHGMDMTRYMCAFKDLGPAPFEVW